MAWHECCDAEHDDVFLVTTAARTVCVDALAREAERTHDVAAPACSVDTLAVCSALYCIIASYFSLCEDLYDLMLYEFGNLARPPAEDVCFGRRRSLDECMVQSET